jgi:hypothetical protein
MTRLLSIITLITFAWTTIAQAFPFHDINSLDETQVCSLSAAAGTLRSNEHCKANNISGINAFLNNTTQTLTGAIEPFIFGSTPLRTGIAGAGLFAAGTGMNTLAPDSGTELQGLGIGLGIGSVLA